MMGGRSCQNRVGLAQVRVGAFEPGQESRDRARADGNMPANLYVPRTDLPRNDPDLLTSLGIGQPEQATGHSIAEPPVDLTQARRRQGKTVDSPVIDPGLNGNVRLGFKLQIAFSRIGAEVVSEGPLDIDRMGVVTFDQVAVIAIHRPHEIGKRTDHSPRQAPP